MASEQEDYAGCLCGHVRGHHAAINYIQGVGSMYCRWKDCGCPRFIPPKEAEPEAAASI